MYAVIESGGHQHRVQVGDVVRVARVDGQAGGSVVFDRVLVVGGDGETKVGTPTLDGVQVRGTVVSQDRDSKVVIYTFKRRKNSARKQRGHRQHFTAVKIDAIEA